MEKKKLKLDREVKIPSGVDVVIDNYMLKFKGPKGEVIKDFTNPRLIITKKDNAISISSPMQKQTKRDKMFINTCVSIINGLILGVLNGYEAKMKICSGHFPMAVSIDNKIFVVKNFLGEKVPRKIGLFEGVNVKLDGEIVKLSGCDKEKVGLAASIIERLCKIKNRDLRVFQDGIWITQKAHEVKNG
ncbi:50S ribosomal protein L6 [Candidatus Woesearchaeota archaeon]|nr:50S ribosomal protein L6 [Candidatus Woesearchaeota archaeon]